VLATPAEAPLADGRAAAAAGLPALIEKPPTATLAEALEGRDDDAEAKVVRHLHRS
jgi:predicted dehydrogenase